MVGNISNRGDGMDAVVGGGEALQRDFVMNKADRLRFSDKREDLERAKSLYQSLIAEYSGWYPRPSEYRECERKVKEIGEKLEKLSIY